MSTQDQFDAITLFTEDLAASRSFYEDVLGLRCIFEDETSAAFQLGSSIVNLLTLPAATQLTSANGSSSSTGTTPRSRP